MDFVCSWLSRYNLQSAQNSTPEGQLGHALNLLRCGTDNPPITLIEVFESYGKVEVEQKHTQQHKEGDEHYRVAA
jgi:hypothetical protein